MGRPNIVVDMSKYDLFRLCEQRYNLRYNRNLTLPTKAQQLDRGQLCHVGNEIYYEALKNGSSYQDAVTASLSKIREAGMLLTDLEPEMIVRVVDVMEEYYDYWRIADQNLRIVAVEQPFLYTLYEDDDVRINIACKIDLIFSDEKYTNKPMDHKSVDRDSEVLRMSNQFKNYCVATGSYFLDVNRIGFQKTLKPHEKFKRVPLSYDSLILEAWKENTIKVLFYYLQCAAENNWPLNETSCDKYHRRCEYYDVCDASGRPAKEYKLATDYITVEPWDVTKMMRKASQILQDAYDAKSKETHSQVQEEEVSDG
jgi:hypothetical protein